MANVFTRKFHRPRTTTLRDFAGNDKEICPPGPRILSPTRRCNPHPKGLVTQQAYNRENMPFDIWNPNFVKINSQMPKMISHLQMINFVSGQVLKPLGSKKILPDINFTINTTSRRNFGVPTFPEGATNDMKTTRFGYSPYSPAQGIVPATLPSISQPAEENKEDENH